MGDTVVINSVARDLLQQAASDYVGLWQIVSSLREQHGVVSETSRRKLALEVIERLLEEGLEVVDFHRGRGWAKWPDQDLHHVLARVEREWDALGKEPSLGDICWFTKPGSEQN